MSSAAICVSEDRTFSRSDSLIPPVCREAQNLLEDSGQVVFEGDPASISDVDAVAQTMLNALGIPEVSMHFPFDSRQCRFQHE